MSKPIRAPIRLSYRFLFIPVNNVLPVVNVLTPKLQDAERPSRHSHAERGNEKKREKGQPQGIAPTNEEPA
ncbi:hypothetical protein PN36_05330, partial [Candidatus Thiomargarita nelsonii]